MKRKEFLLLTASIIFVGCFVYFGLPMFSPKIKTPSSQPFWETSLSTTNDVKVFGLTLNHSTFQDAIDTFGNRVSLTLYETEQGDQIEGYFRETRVGPFMGRMAFTLNKGNIDNKIIKNKIASVKAPMSRDVSYKIPAEMITDFSQNTLFSLAFIPVKIVLTPEDVQARFGTPDLIIEESENGKTTGTMHYLFSEKGVDVTLDKDKRSIIQYISPIYFREFIIDPILKLD